jgi:hypothetical protein
MQRNKPKLKPFRNVVSDEDIKVVPDLAITPSQMLKLAEKGLPISNQSLASEYYDGDVNIDWNVPLDRQRGVDVNEMWNKEQDVKKAMKNMTKDAKRYHDKRKKLLKETGDE